MREASLDEPLESALRQLANDGVIVDFIVLEADDQALPIEAIHRAAATAGMPILSERNVKEIESRRQRFNDRRGLDPSDMLFFTHRPFWRLTFEAAKASATHESVDGFLKDYWQAFSNSPQGPQLPEGEVAKRFDEINLLLFGELAQWSIMRWSTDWSSYFEAGLEWWGAFLWTLVSSDRRRAIWAGASTTD